MTHQPPTSPDLADLLSATVREVARLTVEVGHLAERVDELARLHDEVAADVAWLRSGVAA